MTPNRKRLPNLPKKTHPKAKPKFEFYTLLSNEKLPAHQPQATANTQPVETKPQTVATAAYSLPSTAKAVDASKPNKPTIIKSPPVRPEQAKAAMSTKGKGAFQIQVASFKARKDAEHMKALLTLKGYEVTVAPITNPTGNWFRVLIGPYANRLLAQQAQVVLSRLERLHGMVRCVGG